MTKEMAEAYVADDDLGAKGRLSAFAAAAATGIIARYALGPAGVAHEAWTTAEVMETVRLQRLAEAKKALEPENLPF